MSRTMTANIPGARLREVERRLALLRGAEAINAFLAEHPNEVQVLEQMVEQRRAGKPVPSLTRVQRVMLWSDGHLEFKTEAQPEGRERGAERGPRGERGRSGSQGGTGQFGGGQRAPGGGGAAGGPGGRPGGQVGGPGGRPAQGSGFSGGRGQFGGGGRPGAPRGGGPRGRGRQFGDERGDRGMPRSGEGWVLLRPGEKPPEPDPLPEYEWDEEEGAQPGQESQAPAADATSADPKPE